LQESADQLWEGVGCNFCGGTGYLGRTGVFEVLPVTSSVRKLVSGSASGQEIRAQAISEGMIPMRRAGMLMAKEGVTSVGEILRKVFFID
jgi:type II secretory ATPase GspE/PulE/Tfp pilus assembly ATPase PilB-like protein